MPIETTERRRHPRTNLRQVVFIRPFNSRLPPDSCNTFNVSQNGLYLATLADHYVPGLNIYVTSDFQPGSLIHFAPAGIVVRVEKLEDDIMGVAIHLFSQSLSVVN
jgi:hypothetical protein